MGGFSPPSPPPRKEHPLALAHSGTRHVEPPLLSGQPERAPGAALLPAGCTHVRHTTVTFAITMMIDTLGRKNAREVTRNFNNAGRGREACPAKVTTPQCPGVRAAFSGEDRPPPEQRPRTCVWEAGTSRGGRHE